MFQNVASGLRSGNIFGIHQNTRTSKTCIILVMYVFRHISNDFHWFYVITIRRRFGEIAKHTTDLLPHEPLKAPHVHKTTLCVVFGAPGLVTNFRVPTRCAKYSMICMVLRTRVSETTLCVTFGARLRSVPPHLLDRFLGARTANAAQAFRNRSK